MIRAGAILFRPRVVVLPPLEPPLDAAHAQDTPDDQKDHQDNDNEGRQQHNQKDSCNESLEEG